MHELAATESLLHKALAAAEEGKARKILKIRIGIGRYSGILSEYVEKYYEIAAKGTIAEGAELVFDVLPVHMICSACGLESEVHTGGEEKLICPSCGGAGRLSPKDFDLFVENIEVD